MKTLIAFFVLLIPTIGICQNITGKWTTIDDNSGKQKSVVEIFERNGKYFGRITKLFRETGEDPDPICDECDKDDPRFKKKIIGMEIIRDMKKDGNALAHGDILDPQNGKVYKCKLWIEDNELQVRGYWGPFYRTQSWKRTQ